MASNSQETYLYGMNKNILLIYHSQGGNTEQLMNAVAEGVTNESRSELRIKRALEASIDDVLWADGIILGTPEYFGTMCGALKDFFDRTYDSARSKDIAIPFALFISCDSDGSGAERNILSIANGYVLKKSLDTLIVKSQDTNLAQAQMQEFGQTFAMGIVMGIF